MGTIKYEDLDYIEAQEQSIVVTVTNKKPKVTIYGSWEDKELRHVVNQINRIVRKPRR